MFSNKDEIHVPSPEEIELAKTPKGAWRKQTLASWGVPWPPPKGWKANLKREYERRHSKPNANQETGKIIGYHPASATGWLRPILPGESYCDFCNAFEPGTKVCRVCGRKLK